MGREIDYIHTATTFEEHMAPGVIWFEDPRYAEEFENLVRDDTDPVGREIARHDAATIRYS